VRRERAAGVDLASLACLVAHAALVLLGNRRANATRPSGPVAKSPLGGYAKAVLAM